MSEMFDVSILLLKGQKVPFRCLRNDKVKDLKRKITEQTNKADDKFLLIFHGAIISNDDTTMDDCEISENSNIGMISRLMGGTQIFIKTHDNKTVILEVIETDKIIDVKKKIEEKTGVNMHEQRLIFNNKTLIDSNTVKESSIVANVTINVIQKIKIQIFATLNGRTFAVDVRMDDKVIDVKEKLEEKSKLPVTNQVLFYSGQLLDDDSVLEDIGIYKSCTLTMVSNLHGGLAVKDKR